MLTVFFLLVGEVIVTTPYSLLRLFEHHSLLFCRLCHLVLDEIEVLFSDAVEQVNGLYIQLLKCFPVVHVS